MKKQILSTVLGAGLAVSIAAAAEAKTFVYCSEGSPEGFNPALYTSGTSFDASSRQLFNRLVEFERGTTNIRPALAESWFVSEDGLEYTFKLRQGVKFQGGEDFTAEDVIFSFQRAQSQSSDMKEYVEAVREVKAIDDYTVHIVTEGPAPILPNQLTNIYMMDKGWAEQHNVTAPQNYADKEETFAVRNTNGTGPFVLELREPDTRVAAFGIGV